MDTVGINSQSVIRAMQDLVATSSPELFATIFNDASLGERLYERFAHECHCNILYFIDILSWTEEGTLCSYLDRTIENKKNHSSLHP
jgi:hypothetical protein